VVGAELVARPARPRRRWWRRRHGRTARCLRRARGRWPGRRRAAPRTGRAAAPASAGPGPGRATASFGLPTSPVAGEPGLTCRTICCPVWAAVGPRTPGTERSTTGNSGQELRESARMAPGRGADRFSAWRRTRSCSTTRSAPAAAVATTAACYTAGRHGPMTAKLASYHGAGREKGVMSSCASSAMLGPRWVRVTTVEHGHERSPTVAHGLEEPQVAGPSAHAAGRTQTGDSDCGPEGQAWRRAADGQQPTAVGINTTGGEPWRIVGAPGA
jgi:hypothetical protein